MDKLIIKLLVSRLKLSMDFLISYLKITKEKFNNFDICEVHYVAQCKENRITNKIKNNI